MRLLTELIQNVDQMWLDLKKELNANDVCVKPVGDGCSTGVARLRLVLLCYLPCSVIRCVPEAQLASKDSYLRKY